MESKTTPNSPSMQDDMDKAIALIKKGMKQKEVKSEFLRFNKMNKITWIKKWTELKKIINKKRDLGKTLINKELNAHYQQYVYKLADEILDDTLEKKIEQARKGLQDDMTKLLKNYSKDEILKVIAKTDIDKTIKKASQISQEQLKKEEDCVYNNLNTDQGAAGDCIVHAWNAFLNFSFIQQLEWTPLEVETPRDHYGAYCKWKEKIIPVLNDNKPLIEQSVKSHSAEIDTEVQEWFKVSLNDYNECNDEWMQAYNLGTIQLMSIANLFHPNRQNEIILFTQITLESFINDNGTKFDSSYGAIPINTQITIGDYDKPHAICFKKSHGKLFVVDSWSGGWQGVHPYEAYKKRTNLRPIGTDKHIKVLVKINTEASILDTEARILAKTDKINDELRSLYTIKKIKRFKLCHTNKSKELSECPFTKEFKQNCDK
jgi:hypothetical protein